MTSTEDSQLGLFQLPQHVRLEVLVIIALLERSVKPGSLLQFIQGIHLPFEGICADLYNPRRVA